MVMETGDDVYSKSGKWHIQTKLRKAIERIIQGTRQAEQNSFNNR